MEDFVSKLYDILPKETLDRDVVSYVDDKFDNPKDKVMFELLMNSELKGNKTKVQI